MSGILLILLLIWFKQYLKCRKHICHFFTKMCNSKQIVWFLIPNIIQYNQRNIYRRKHKTTNNDDKTPKEPTAHDGWIRQPRRRKTIHFAIKMKAGFPIITSFASHLPTTVLVAITAGAGSPSSASKDGVKRKPSMEKLAPRQHKSPSTFLQQNSGTELRKWRSGWGMKDHNSSTTRSSRLCSPASMLYATPATSVARWLMGFHRQPKACRIQPDNPETDSRTTSRRPSVVWGDRRDGEGLTWRMGAQSLTTASQPVNQPGRYSETFGFGGRQSRSNWMILYIMEKMLNGVQWQLLGEYLTFVLDSV